MENEFVSHEEAVFQQLTYVSHLRHHEYLLKQKLNLLFVGSLLKIKIIFLGV